MYVRMAAGATPAALREALSKAYETEPFVKILPAGVVPQTRHVRGSNFVLVNVFEVMAHSFCVCGGGKGSGG